MSKEEKSLEVMVREQIAKIIERLLPSQAKQRLGDEEAILFVSRLLGLSPEEWSEHPELAQKGIHELIGRIASILDLLFTQDEIQTTIVQAKVQELITDLQSVGFSFDIALLESLPERLHHFYRNNPDQAFLDHALKQLHRFAQNKSMSGQTIWGELHELVEWLYTEEDPNKRYYEQGRQVVRENFKPPKLSVKQILAEHRKKREAENESK